MCIDCGDRRPKGRGRCNRCYTYWFSTGKCWSPSVTSVREGEASHKWKGDAARDQSKRMRAQKIYKLGPCNRCPKPGRERHHRDRNPGNNAPENIEILCHSCHKLEHLWKPPRTCRTCGELFSRRGTHGRCHTCAEYFRSRGVERPAALIARAREKSARGGKRATACDLELAEPARISAH